MALEVYGKAILDWAESFGQHATAGQTTHSTAAAKPSLLSKDSSAMPDHLGQFAAHAADALMAAVGACAGPMPGTQQVCEVSGTGAEAALHRHVGTGAPGKASAPQAVPAATSGATAAPFLGWGMASLTDEQRQWMYDTAVEFEKGTGTRPPTADMCTKLGVAPTVQRLRALRKIFSIMRHRAVADVGPTVQRVQRKYRIPMWHKARMALMSLPGQQGNALEVYKYVHSRIDWHDDLKWGTSLVSASSGPVWQDEILCAIHRAPYIISTSEKRDGFKVYRYDPTLDPATAPRPASRTKGLKGLPLKAGPAHGPVG